MCSGEYAVGLDPARAGYVRVCTSALTRESRPSTTDSDRPDVM